MQVAPWEDMTAMMNNSPLNRIHVMAAKSVRVEIGGEDPTVDMRQGVEFYNYARRAGKHVVMLLYPGEGHSLSKKENAIDYEPGTSVSRRPSPDARPRDRQTRASRTAARRHRAAQARCRPGSGW